MRWWQIRKRRADFERELHSDLELEKEEQRERGVSPEEVELAARRAFGNETLIKEQTYEARERRWAPFERLWQDVRFGVRLLLRDRGFAVVALLTLALGIGATTAAFSLVDAVLLRPLPYRASNRLVEIFEDESGAGLGLKYDADTPGSYADLKRQTQIFEDVAAVDGGNEFSLLGDGAEPRTITDESVTSNLFPMLGVQPLYGRVFTQAEDRPGYEHVVLLSFRLWQERFGGDRQIIGRDIRLNNRVSVQRYTVIGIMPPHFSFPEKNADIWIPRAFTQQEFNSHGEHYVMVFARLKDGISLSRTNSGLRLLADQIRQLYPVERSLHRIFAESLQEAYTRDSRGGLLLLMGCVAAILLIACANLANLLLSRSIARQREIGLRTALGASRGRLIRQLLTESALLGLCGGVLGVALAWGSFAFLKNLIPADLSQTVSLSLDLRLLGFVLLLSLLSGALFGLAPALRLSKGDLNAALREGARGTIGPRRNSLGSALVAGEIALSLVLLIGGSLLLESFLRFRNVDPGFRSDHVLVMGHFLRKHPANRAEFEKRTQTFQQMLEAVRALPGVERAGFTSELPLGWAGGRGSFTPEGAQSNPAVYTANNRVITPGYLEALRISLIRGRFFNQADGLNAPAAVIVNQTMARTFWPNQNPVGKQLKFGEPDSQSPWAQIVGVVGDVRQVDLSQPPGPEMFFPYWQAFDNYMTPILLAVQTKEDPMSLASALRHAIHSIDGEQPTDDVYALDELIDSDIAPRRLQASLTGGLAILALVIASVGIYGVMAYLVSQRTQEMGIRMALGAKRSDVLALVLGRGAKIAMIGLAVGICAAVALTRLMRSLLFEVSAVDPGIFAGVSALLLLVTIAACVVPARRAASIDPIRALRND